MLRLVLDTDIFGDPDDLYALLFLLASPNVKIELIVTGDEHGCGRAAYTVQLLRELGIDIPVYCGEDLGNTRCYFATAARKAQASKEYVRAVASLRKGFTYVCISPPSQLAKVIDILQERKAGILIMGGSTQKPEHNIRCDTKAALRVLESGAPARWVPSDLTVNDAIKIDRTHPLYLRAAASGTSAAVYLKRNMDLFFESLYPAHYLHDPLAVATLFDERVVTFARKKLTLRNAQFFPADEGFAVEYGVRADYSRFWALFGERVMQWL